MITKHAKVNFATAVKNKTKQNTTAILTKQYDLGRKHEEDEH